MNPQQSGSATLPRGFRYLGLEQPAPRTPEPSSRPAKEPALPSPPKPPTRLRLKRRNVSDHLAAPTQQFLASVAAADVPIPSIEEPPRDREPQQDDSMSDTIPFPLLPMLIAESEGDSHLLRPRHPAFSPPRTPAPIIVPFLSPMQYPNWTLDSRSSIESTPDCESSRPSTSRSTQTSASLFSRMSQFSDADGEQCTSPGADCVEKHQLVRHDIVIAAPEAAKGKSPSRKAPWTKAMSAHLWSTYNLYLQDPKVTPFRPGHSGIPPQGVCMRVAQEAKRSWKGSKALSRLAHPSAFEGKKSGSSTPTAESMGTYIQWPHTCAATRARLRELCKDRASLSARNLGLMSRSPTPFGQAPPMRPSSQRMASVHNLSAFATDMSKSLVLSTSESMQAHGPLAQITGTAAVEAGGDEARLAAPTTHITDFDLGAGGVRCLGSPFVGAKSYGPSSSTNLSLGSPLPRRRTHTIVGARQTLLSPVRLTSRPGTQRRRNTQSSAHRKRPSIASDLWLEPGKAPTAAAAATNSGSVKKSAAAPPVPPMPSFFPEFSSTNSSRHDKLFIPRSAVQPPHIPWSASMPEVRPKVLPVTPPRPIPNPVPDAPPARLGSPFRASRSSSLSFPSRWHRRSHQAGSVDLGILGRPYATLQTTTEPRTMAKPGASAAEIKSAAADGIAANNAPSSALAGRLAYLDQRLKELRSRNPAKRRSGSPM